MGAQQNAERIRGGYDAFNKADIEALTDLFAEDAVWHSPGRGVVAGDYKGRDATFDPAHPKIRDRSGAMLYPMYHPGYVIRGAYDARQYVRDFRRLRRRLGPR